MSFPTVRPGFAQLAVPNLNRGAASTAVRPSASSNPQVFWPTLMCTGYSVHSRTRAVRLRIMPASLIKWSVDCCSSDWLNEIPLWVWWGAGCVWWLDDDDLESRDHPFNSGPPSTPTSAFTPDPDVFRRSSPHKLKQPFYPSEKALNGFTPNPNESNKSKVVLQQVKSRSVKEAWISLSPAWSAAQSMASLKPEIWKVNLRFKHLSQKS